MMSLRRLCTLAVVAVTGVGLAVVGTASGGAAVPGTVSPVVATTPGMVRVTAMPTVQIDGVVWAQAVVGSTVFAGGSFANARPSGAAPGTNQTPRTNLLAYNLTTGALVTSFAPVLNGSVRTITASPDGRTVYVGGQFTTVNGQGRYRVAAFDVASGALLPWAPALNYNVYAIAATSSTVFLGGAFSTAMGQPRNDLAAVTASTGALLPWNPSADNNVFALALSPDATHLVVGGSFDRLNTTQALGLGALDTTTGATLPFAVNQKLYSYGSGAAFLSLSTYGNTVYGSAYNYYGKGNIEGSFSADVMTGAVNWIEDCHGDTYSVFGNAAAVYAVGHPHFCGNIGGYPQTPSAYAAHRALAFTVNATGTIQHNSQPGYADLYGNPSPSLVDWYPDLTPGTVSGSSQAAWSVAGNDTYLVLGGEFTAVNGVNQQGLTRMAIAPPSPDTSGPQLSGTAWTPTFSSLGKGALRVAFGANWDRDDMTLNYAVTRDTGPGTPGAVAWQGSAASLQWALPTLAFADTGLSTGTTYRYQLVATDPAGNRAVGGYVTATAPTSGTLPTNNPPTASFTSSVSGATVSVDGTGSTDPSGQVTRWAWDFGDGSTASTATATHTYAASGTYPVRLTVTDDRGVTGTTSRQVSVTVPPRPPVASFTATTTGLSVSADASASTAPGATVTGYQWNFGDGSSATGVRAAHTYAASGSYAVGLTVSSSNGTSSSTSQPVVVSSTPVVLAQDSFGRVVSNGWGTADRGGAWTYGAAAAGAYAVNSGTATMAMAAPGAAPVSFLGTTALTDTSTTADVALDKLPDPGAYVSLVARHSGNGDYRLRLKVLPSGQDTVTLTKVVGVTETVLSSVAIAGPTVVPGGVLHLRLQVTGSAQASMAAKVWSGASEPAGWQITATDTGNPLTSGVPGFAGYLSGSATNAPVTLAVTAFSVSSVPA